MGGVLSILRLGPWNTKNSCIYAPAMSQQRPAVRPRCVLAGGKIAGGEGPAWHELQDPGNSLGGTGNGGSRPATRRCGGRGGASPFPAKDQRTWGSKARMSTRRSCGCDSRTWIGRGNGGGMLSTVRWSSGGSGERRLWVGAISAKEGRGWTGSGRGG
jgi:hypothetical protein